MLNITDKNTLKRYFNNTLDLNPRAGSMTTIRQGCEFNDIVLPQSEMMSLANEFLGAYFAENQALLMKLQAGA